jgi:hypothetical protein
LLLELQTLDGRLGIKYAVMMRENPAVAFIITLLIRVVWGGISMIQIGISATHYVTSQMEEDFIPDDVDIYFN